MIKLRFSHYFQIAKNYFFPDQETRRFIKFSREAWGSWKPAKPESVILLDLYGVCETEVARSYFLNVLAKKNKSRILSFSPRRGNPNLHRLYRSFNVDGHIVPKLDGKQKKEVASVFAELRTQIKSKQDVFSLKILGLQLGVDIYETFLREYSQPTFELSDPRAWPLIEQGVALAIFWRDFFTKNKVAAVVVSHDCYLSFNVVCKSAYSRNVPVYLPNPIYLNYADRPFLTHQCFWEYRKLFNSLDEKTKVEGIELAKRQLARRFSGEVGVDMAYSTASAFKAPVEGKRVLQQSDRTKVLICSHCFYDNPQAYGNSLFNDFYDWIDFLGAISEETNYDWYIKVHPDPLPGTLEVIKFFTQKYKRIQVLPRDTSHLQMAKEGIDYVLTVYGTVGHEYPALGVQVINAGFNPHVAYDFNWHPKSRDEYRHLLLNLDNLEKKKLNVQDLYEFYFMNHYYRYRDDLVFPSYRELVAKMPAKDRVSPGVFKYFLDGITKEKHEQIIARMSEFIDSGKRYFFSSGPTDLPLKEKS